MSTERCRHVREHGEATVWPRDASLDHFLHCMSLAEQLGHWTTFCELAEQAHSCFARDHVGQLEGLRLRVGQLNAGIQAQDDYIGQQVAKLRELEAYCAAEPGVPLSQEYVAAKVTEILGISSHVEGP
jgi:hypothetical protein